MLDISKQVLYLANSEGPHEIPQKAAFHQSTLFAMIKTVFRDTYAGCASFHAINVSK